MISSIRLDGLTTCMAVESATDTIVFQAYLEQVLAPTLREGDLVIMDNLRAHKAQICIQTLEAAGAQALFLPAYSPDLNPIEKMWSKIKTSLRAQEARTTTELLQAIKEAFAGVTQQDAMGWFVSCGYSFI